MCSITHTAEQGRKNELYDQIKQQNKTANKVAQQAVEDKIREQYW